MTRDAAALTHLLVHSLHEGFTVVWVTHEDGKTVGSESVGFSTRDLTLNPASPSISRLPSRSTDHRLRASQLPWARGQPGHLVNMQVLVQWLWGGA